MSTNLPPQRGAAMGNAHRTLWLGVMLASVGGFLDAFTYVGKSHVFANAMSGNIVLMALAIQAGDWERVSRSLSALAAFMVGVIVANTLRLPRVNRVIRQPHITALIVEMILLALIGTAPDGVPDTVILLGVTFVAAVQTSTFRQLTDWTFTSTMSTGNLRSLADALVDWATGRSRLDARKIRHFASVCFAFFVGAVIGGVTTTYWGDRAALVVAVLVSCCVILMALRLHKERPQLPLRPRAELPFFRFWSPSGRRPSTAAHILTKTGGTMRGVATGTIDPSQEETP